MSKILVMMSTYNDEKFIIEQLERILRLNGVDVDTQTPVNR